MSSTIALPHAMACMVGVGGTEVSVSLADQRHAARDIPAGLFAAVSYNIGGMISHTTPLPRFLAVTALTAGMIASTAVAPANAASPTTYTGDVALTDVAFVYGPTGMSLPADIYVDNAVRLYMDPLGFSGTASAQYTPALLGNTDNNLQASLVNMLQQTSAIEDSINAENPLWMFGYSQSAAALAYTARELEAQGWDADSARFVLVGNSASANGGWLNSFVDSLPTWARDFATTIMADNGLADSNGLTTPDFFRTDVYTISTDGYASWPSSVADIPAVLNAMWGMLLTHQLYFGLTPEQIAGATLDFTEGQTNYYTIDINDIDVWDTLVNAGVNVGYIPDWLGDILT